MLTDSACLKELGEELGRHFLKREGALIDYSLCLHNYNYYSSSFQPVPTLNEIDGALEYRHRSRIVATSNCVLKLIVAAASIRSYTNCALSPHPYAPHQVVLLTDKRTRSTTYK